MIILLSRDNALTEALPGRLAVRDPGIEVQVVPTIERLLTYMGSVQPDALVIDTDSLGNDELRELLTSGPGAEIPTIVLDSELGAGSKNDILEAGAASFIRRDPQVLERLSEEIFRTRRVAAIASRSGEAEQHYLNILEASSDGIFVLIGGIFRYLNSSFLNALGRSPEELLNTTALVTLVVPEDRRLIGEQLRRVEASEGNGELLELNLTTPAGRRIFEVSCRSSVVDGQRAVVGVARDVTEVRRLQHEVERARRRAAHVERLRALGELAAGVAHDFNNALGTILGRVRIARDKQARQEPVIEELMVMERAATNAVATVKRIQEFSRPAGGETWEDVDLVLVVRDAVDFIRTRVPNGVTLATALAPTPVIRGNGSELREVMLNLLNNALDSVTLGCRVAVSCGEEEGQAVVTVEDDGCGIPHDVQQRIFEPFFSTKAASGTGLGLSVSHWILRRHDARFELTSEPGRGTRFRLLFAPFAPAIRETPQIDKAVLGILVVDDDECVAELISDLLSEHGHEVTVVGSAEGACRLLGEQSVDLVISDLDLPDMSGWELTRRVRRQRPETIVGLVTGWPLGVSNEELRARGVDFALSKPFTIEALTEAVNRARRKG